MNINQNRCFRVRRKFFFKFLYFQMARLVISSCKFFRIKGTMDIHVWKLFFLFYIERGFCYEGS